jgi:ATP synthase protein I
MTDGRDNETKTIARKVQQMEEARRRHRESAWYGLGMFGLVGWSVAVPVVAGVALGVWIDRKWPGEVSWTLILLLAGAVFGALNAWYWVQWEGRDD